MPKTNVGSVELFYETHGDPSGSPLLLIMGLGAQMILWDEEFVQLLVDRGHYVIRFDNRDVGESTHLSHLPKRNMMEAIMASMGGQKVDAPYSLQDMANDVIGLLDALKLQTVHVVGASMGGMIAQVIALTAPSRVRSLTSIMSTTGERSLPQPQPQALMALSTVMSSESNEGRLPAAIAAYKAISSPAYPFDEEKVAQRMRRSVQRGFSPAGVARQFLAVLSTPGRGQALQSLNVPTLVIHGEEDPLIPLAAGQATAAAIPSAKLITFPGMGHDMPQPLWSQLTTAIADHAADAERTRPN